MFHFIGQYLPVRCHSSIDFCPFFAHSQEKRLHDIYRNYVDSIVKQNNYFNFKLFRFDCVRIDKTLPKNLLPINFLYWKNSKWNLFSGNQSVKLIHNKLQTCLYVFFELIKNKFHSCDYSTWSWLRSMCHNIIWIEIAYVMHLNLTKMM